jgi:hypothetical protein
MNRPEFVIRDWPPIHYEPSFRQLESAALWLIGRGPWVPCTCPFTCSALHVGSPALSACLQHMSAIAIHRFVPCRFTAGPCSILSDVPPVSMEATDVVANWPGAVTPS